jgi:Zn-dependent protease with chaperone function
MAEARFFDGETAVERDVTVTLSRDALDFAGPQVARHSWPFAGLKPVARREAGKALRLTHDSAPGTRLIIPDGPFLKELIARAPYAGGAINYRRAARTAAVVAIALAATALSLYAVLTLAPQQFAFLMPQSWRDRLGHQIENSFIADVRLCGKSSGNAALADLEKRLREGNPDLPPFSIAVYDLPMINAFALPGDRIIVTRKLIETASAADQVAGVIAHEIGHVVNRHPEAQLIRAAGLQVLLALFTGGTGGDTLSGIAGMLAILRYSRDAEREADSHALGMMAKAGIDPMGLKRFFEEMRKQEGGGDGGVFGDLTSIIATHPLTDDRIAQIKPLPPGAAREVMPAARWEELKAICGAS